MPPRTSWKGFLKLSLISVPVKAYTAHDTSEDVHLNQLHADCHNRIRYQKTCPEHGVVGNDEIVSGYEHAKGQYVVIDADELAKMRPESDRAVRIDGFVDPASLDPVLFAGKTYYLLPDGVVGAKPYALLHRAMLDNGVCAVAQVVLTGRDQLVVLRPIGGMLSMSVLSYANKVHGADEYSVELGEQEMSADELTLATTLIKATTLQSFDHARYKDGYADQLAKLIQLKIDGQEIVQVPEPEEPKILNLMEALKRSVAQAQAGTERDDASATSPGTGAKKMAPSAASKKAGRRKTGS